MKFLCVFLTCFFIGAWWFQASNQHLWAHRAAHEASQISFVFEKVENERCCTFLK